MAMNFTFTFPPRPFIDEENFFVILCSANVIDKINRHLPERMRNMQRIFDKFGNIIVTYLGKKFKKKASLHISYLYLAHTYNIYNVRNIILYIVWRKREHGNLCSV
jgi:hypothetical protein